MGLYSGAIDEITRMDKWEGREPQNRFRFPVLVRGVAPTTFPEEICSSTAFGYDLTIDAQGHVTSVDAVRGYGADIDGPLKRRSEEFAAVLRRWRYAPRGVSAPFRTRVGILLLVSDEGGEAVDLMPEFTQDSLVLKRPPCVE
jgi:hypothetical protein